MPDGAPDILALTDVKDALDYVKGIETKDKAAAAHLMEAEQALRRAASRLTAITSQLSK